MFGAEDFYSTTNVSRETLDRLKIYAQLLTQWQKKINLVGPSTIEDMWFRHFYDSAQLFSLVSCQMKQKAVEKPLKWIDFGAGAGFPGLVLSIMGAGEVHLVESNGKKCTFMRQVIQQTGANAVVHQARIENMTPFAVDVITSRALATVEQLLQFSQPFLQKNTKILFLKGQDVDEELTKATISRNIELVRHQSKTDPRGTILEMNGLFLGGVESHD